MVEVNIGIKDGQHRFLVGGTISGIVHLNLPKDIPLTNVAVMFRCIGQVKWIELPGTPYYQNGYVYYDEVDFVKEELKWSEKGGYKL